MTRTLQWFKSSYSDDSGGQCLETAYTWHKSSYSNDSGGQCLEIAPCPQAIHIRDSKTAPDGPTLTLSPATWAAFLEDTAP
ncbi:DUF397 domain-containing protein [Streptomyces fuscichromogenes]|uniref:DUF397 domain-containing protein n=1 Tax=Streptomyces fuscichromogenes TaxID=1324013 RepID=UPI00381999C0